MSLKTALTALCLSGLSGLSGMTGSAGLGVAAATEVVQSPSHAASPTSHASPGAGTDVQSLGSWTWGGGSRKLLHGCHGRRRNNKCALSRFTRHVQQLGLVVVHITRSACTKTRQQRADHRRCGHARRSGDCRASVLVVRNTVPVCITTPNGCSARTSPGTKTLLVITTRCFSFAN